MFKKCFNDFLKNTTISNIVRQIVKIYMHVVKTHIHNIDIFGDCASSRFSSLPHVVIHIYVIHNKLTSKYKSIDAKMIKIYNREDIFWSLLEFTS